MYVTNVGIYIYIYIFISTHEKKHKNFSFLVSLNQKDITKDKHGGKFEPITYYCASTPV